MQRERRAEGNEDLIYYNLKKKAPNNVGTFKQFPQMKPKVIYLCWDILIVTLDLVVKTSFCTGIYLLKPKNSSVSLLLWVS